jgi:hypothetical protein
MAAKPESSTEDRGKTPPTWSTPKDAREGSGEYPNCSVRKTRSGHVIMIDDTKDKEHLTFQHRSGSMLQFLPDGAIQSVANKGRFDTTFGEYRSKVTGAQDTTVDGDSSTITKGDVNTTTYGNSVQAVNGSMVSVADSLNQSVKNQADLKAGTRGVNVNEYAVKGNGITLSSRRSTSVTSGGKMTIGGTTGTAIASRGNIAVSSKYGPIGIGNDQGGRVVISGVNVFINSAPKVPEITHEATPVA